MSRAAALETLRATPREVARIAQEAGEMGLDAELPGEWSLRTTVAHLRDEEWRVFRMRVERMLGENGPQFALFPPDRWERERDMTGLETRSLLRAFALQREASLNLLDLLDEERWHRQGHHSTRGAQTIESWLIYWATHDRDHVEQMNRTLQAVKRP